MTEEMRMVDTLRIFMILLSMTKSSSVAAADYFEAPVR